MPDNFKICKHLKFDNMSSKCRFSKINVRILMKPSPLNEVLGVISPLDQTNKGCTLLILSTESPSKIRISDF